jgi:hypothetical protein
MIFVFLFSNVGGEVHYWLVRDFFEVILTLQKVFDIDVCRSQFSHMHARARTHTHTYKYMYTARVCMQEIAAVPREIG